MSSTLPRKAKYEYLRTLVSGAQIMCVLINKSRVYTICYECRPDEVCRRHNSVAAAINSHLMGGRIDNAIASALSDSGTDLSKYKL